MRKTVIALGLVSLIAAVAPASAAQYTFSFSGNSLFPFGLQTLAGSGIFTTSDTGVSVIGDDPSDLGFKILSVSGTVNGSNIVAPVNANGYGFYFVPTSAFPNFLDGTGSTFSTAAGQSVTFFDQSSNDMFRVNTMGNGIFSGFVTATSSPVVAAVPEPSTWAMMILGFFGVGFMAYRRKQNGLAFRVA
jgi:hypothetical protein